jgi:lipocalin-like protein
MNRSSVLSISAATVLGFTMLSGNAIAQQKPLKEQLVGLWTPVSVDEVRPDGSKVPAFGPNPKGILIFDSSGRFAYVVSGSGRPKFASNNRMTGTPEENKAVSQGSLAYAGRYSVSEADKTLIFHVEASTFPNAEGAEQKRVITLTGDELKYTNPATTTGGKAEAVWKRAN